MTEILDQDAEIERRRFYLFRPCTSREELRSWLIAYLGLDLPDCIVDDDSNSTPLDMVWEAYSKMLANDDEGFTRVLYYACRDGFKTLGMAAIEVLAILHLGRSTAHMAAIKEQAGKAQSYVKKAFRRPHLRDYVVGDNKLETKIVRFYNPNTKHSLTTAEYEALSEEHKGQHTEIATILPEYREREEYIKIVVCTMQGANSEHVPLFCVDEVDVVKNPAAYAEAQNIPSSRNGKRALTILASTRKTAFGLVQDEITSAEQAAAKGEVVCHIRHWNINEITAPCEASRHKCGIDHAPGHCPATPSVVVYRNDDLLRSVSEDAFRQMAPKDQEACVQEKVFPGCTSCRLAPTCRTWLATRQHSKSTFLNSIPDVIAKFRNNQRTLDMVKSQLMCRKPSSVGLIYPRFVVQKHVLSPAQVYEKVFGEPWKAPNRRPSSLTKAELLAAVRTREVQWYGAMDFGDQHNYVYSHSFKDGARMFVTNVFSASGLGIDEQVRQVEHYADDRPVVFPDMADKQAIRIFSKVFNVRKWNKGPGTVASGITAVSAKLNPVWSDEPELFFVHDVDEDPHMDLMIRRVQEYHWKLDAAGQPTAAPQDDDDDEVDCLRYLVMNVFPMKGAGIVSALTELEPQSPPQMTQGGQKAYDPNTWVADLIAEHSGQAPPAPQERRMKVETPTATGYSSYYDEDEVSAEKGRPSRTKKEGYEPTPTGGRSGRLIW